MGGHPAVSRLAELWHPNPHNQDVWLLPDEEVSEESVICLTWAYGHNGWVDFKKSIPEDVQVDNPLSKVQSKNRVPDSLTSKVSLETWQSFFTEIQQLLDTSMVSRSQILTKTAEVAVFASLPTLKS